MSRHTFFPLSLVFALFVLHLQYSHISDGARLGYSGVVYCDYPARMIEWNTVHLKTFKPIVNETEQRCSYEGMEQRTDEKGAFRVSVNVIRGSNVNSTLWIAHTCNFKRDQSYYKYEPNITITQKNDFYDAGRLNLTEHYDCHLYIDPCPEYVRRK